MENSGDQLAIFFFGIGVLWLGYVYAGYPAALWLLSWIRRVSPQTRNDYLPSVSVLISAHNEEQDIEWKVKQTLKWHYPADRLQLLVASDASTDRTDEILRSMGHPQLTYVRMDNRAGKNRALNRLAQRATGELLFFTDANSSIAPHSLRHVVRYFADERVGCVTGEMHERDKVESAIDDGARVYWGYESLVKSLESALGSVLVCVGSIFCIRRSLYTPLQADVANDVELPLRIGHQGHWLLYDPSVRSVESSTRSAREEFQRRRRICSQGMLAMWKCRKYLWNLRGWQFVSRKFLRWLTLIPLLLILVSTARLSSHGFFFALLGLQVLFYLLALSGGVLLVLGRGGVRLISVPFYIVWVSVAGLVGVLEACFGRRFRVWESASMSRGKERLGAARHISAGGAQLGGDD